MFLVFVCTAMADVADIRAVALAAIPTDAAAAAAVAAAVAVAVAVAAAVAAVVDAITARTVASATSTRMNFILRVAWQSISWVGVATKFATWRM